MLTTPRATSPDPGTPAGAPKAGPGMAPPTPASAPVALAGVSSDECPPPPPHAPPQHHQHASPAAPRPPLPPRAPAPAPLTTTSSDASGSDLVHAHQAGGGAAGGRGASPSPSALLPKHTLVRVVGNARTRASLVGLEGRVRRSVGLGGWHLLTVRVWVFVLFSWWVGGRGCGQRERAGERRARGQAPRSPTPLRPPPQSRPTRIGSGRPASQCTAWARAGVGPARPRRARVRVDTSTDVRRKRERAFFLVANHPSPLHAGAGSPRPTNPPTAARKSWPAHRGGVRHRPRPARPVGGRSR
jgi:hypothetical protein